MTARMRLLDLSDGQIKQALVTNERSKGGELRVRFEGHDDEQPLPPDFGERFRILGNPQMSA